MFRRNEMIHITMDPLLRGLCEQKIDEKLFSEELETIKEFVETIDLEVNSKENYEIVFFLGTVYDELVTQCMSVYNRSPNENEKLIFHELLKRRISDVRAMFRERDEPKIDERKQIMTLEDLEVPQEVVGSSKTSDLEIDWSLQKRKSIFGIPIRP